MDMFDWERDWEWEVEIDAKSRLIRGLEGEYEHKWVWARFRKGGRRHYRGGHLNLRGWSNWLEFGFIFGIKVRK